MHSLAFEARSVLRPSSAHLDLAALDLTFTIRAGEWFMDVLFSAVVANITKAAPHVRLRFVPKHEADPDLLRDGFIDLEIGFPDAMRVAASSDLIAIVPRASLANAFIKDQTTTLGIQEFEIPVRMPEILVFALWHPRVDADPAQLWLRQAVISVCKNAYTET